ncbi:hypothetical protein JTF06_02405 [Desemzia sp. RIT804]|uniref:EbsA family protein n=1 Tax=Desemzia sp. RIT 804 TaxID=2810209 RepID=UPI0019507538|nr:hypothetical protein [Desemzia sp. RIT 804]
MKRSKKTRFILSFEPAYQIIYWSISWLTFFIAVIAMLEYTSINLISIIFALLTIGLVVLARTIHLKIENDQLFFYCCSKQKKIISVTTIHKIIFSKMRVVVLLNSNDSEQYRFYLNQKNKEIFLSYMKEHYPEIILEEQQVASNEY